MKHILVLLFSVACYAQAPKCVWVMTSTNTFGCVAPTALGIAGTPGPVGAIGPAGAIGPPGTSGATGAVGAVGATGAQGPAGATGPTGPQGIPGASGGVTGSPCPTAAQVTGPTAFAQLLDGTCIPLIIIGSNLAQPSLVMGFRVDYDAGGHPTSLRGTPEFVAVEYREPGHYLDAERTLWIPYDNCGGSQDCMHGGMLVKKL